MDLALNTLQLFICHKKPKQNEISGTGDLQSDAI